MHPWPFLSARSSQYRYRCITLGSPPSSSAITAPFPFLTGSQGVLTRFNSAWLHLRQNESISVDPVWIGGIEAHEFVKEDVGCWSQAHGGARMPRVGLEGRIDLSK